MQCIIFLLNYMYIYCLKQTNFRLWPQLLTHKTLLTVYGALSLT